MSLAQGLSALFTQCCRICPTTETARIGMAERHERRRLAHLNATRLWRPTPRWIQEGNPHAALRRLVKKPFSVRRPTSGSWLNFSGAIMSAECNMAPS
jgi:hypothetical protein